MGFFLRKSIKFGPFRINLSKSGIGVSGGIKGARISAGPRDSQLSLGRKGLYYRKQLSTRTVRGGGWLARLIAYFLPPKQITTIEPLEASPSERIATFMRQGNGPDSAKHVVSMVDESLRRKRIASPKQHVSYANYSLPPIEFLNEAPLDTQLTDEELLGTAARLGERLKEFDVTGQVKHICPGPIFTSYEFQPDPGVKYSRLTSLADDLCLTVKAESIDIERIPGTAKVAIRVPNRQREIIYLRDIIVSRAFRESASKLTVGLGKTLDGLSYVVDLAKMPHLLVAGAPGMGKSVLLHSLIISLLYRARPDEVKLILIDSAGVEMNLYSDIPHLVAPVIKESALAATVLDCTVKEMERRYRELSGWGVREIDSYNTELMRRNLVKEFDEQGEPWRPLPYIVICMDDLSDLLNDRQVETCISRLAQKGHTAGIHLVLATQRPFRLRCSRSGDHLASRLAELAHANRETMQRILAISSQPLAGTRRDLYLKLVSQIGSVEAVLAGLEFLDDADGYPVLYDLWKALEAKLFDKRPVREMGGAYNLEPRSANEIRAKLFSLASSGDHRSQPAFKLLGEIEVRRLEDGRPPSELRHPSLDSGLPWPRSKPVSKG